MRRLCRVMGVGFALVLILDLGLGTAAEPPQSTRANPSGLEVATPGPDVGSPSRDGQPASQSGAIAKDDADTQLKTKSEPADESRQEANRTGVQATRNRDEVDGDKSDDKAVKEEADEDKAAQSDSAGLEVELPQVDPLEVKGNLVVVGSAVVAPIIRRLYRRFITEGYRGVMKISSVGTKRGVKIFCQGERADIVLTSRPLKAHETLACTAKGISPVELEIGVDLLTVVVNIENDFLYEASSADLIKLFTVNRWSDVNSDFPNDLIQRFIPAPGSGTLDIFIDAVLGDAGERMLIAANTQRERDPESIAKEVGNVFNGVGIVGYAFFKKYEDSLKAIIIDEVEPTRETAESGDYPLTRELFVYSDMRLIREKPQVKTFVIFLLNHIREEIEKVGYFPSDDDAMIESKLSLLEALGIALK